MKAQPEDATAGAREAGNRTLAGREARRAREAAEVRAKAASRRTREAAEAGRRREREAYSQRSAQKAAREAARDEEIRRLWAEGVTGRALAARYGMAPSTVSGIVSGLPRPLRYADPEFAPRLASVPRAAVPPAAPPGPGDRLVGDGVDYAQGSRHGRARLDEAKVIEMRRLRAEGWSTGRLAERYGVSRNTVCYALAGKTWRHVPGGARSKGGSAC